MNKEKKMDAKEMIKVLVVDDHAVVRQGLMRLIDRQDQMAVVGEAENARKALDFLAEQKIDCALVDISMKGASGLQLTEKIKAMYPELPVVILSIHDELLYVRRAMRAGAKGYVVKEEAPEEILTAIRKVIGGEIFISTNMAAKMPKTITQ